jgi:hypothetical protein
MQFSNSKHVGMAIAFVLCACAQEKPADPPVAAAPSESATTTTATVEAPTSKVNVKPVIDIATDAYVFGYSLMTSEVTRVQSTNVSKVEGIKAPLNELASLKRYPPADFRGVTTPNADTLYSVGWLDLAEPQVLSHPDMGKRYYLFQLMDLWTRDFKSIGARTDGYKAASYLVTGPGWKGDVPKGLTHVSSASRYVVVIARTYADGTDRDFRTVNALQAKYKITPLSAWGKPYTFHAPPVNANPGISMTDSPQKVLLGMPAPRYFDEMARLMCKDAPPAQEDAPILDRMAKIGIEPCKPFDATRLDPAIQSALEEIPSKALQIITAHRDDIGTNLNGWVAGTNLGTYGTDYMKRAVVSAFGWGANLPEDAVYAFAHADSAGQKLSGARAYSVTFPKGQTPPVNAFWSITMYEEDNGLWFYPNPANKFTLSPRNHLKYDKDGSLTVFFQHDSPGKAKEANWLPAPAGDFVLALRMYWPKTQPPSIINGTWKPPQIVAK